jgi:hypothetical protein
MTAYYPLPIARRRIMSNFPEQAADQPLHYPTNAIFGIIDHPEDVHAARIALLAAGFGDDAVELYHGAEQALRADEAPHGRGLRAWMAHIRAIGGEEREFVERHKDALLAGHTLIGVMVRDDTAKHKARTILKQHHAHFINFYGSWSIEELEP